MKGDGGLRATDEERQAAAAAGIDPRRAQGLAGMTPAEIAERQIELEKEREMRKAGLAVPPYKMSYKKKAKGSHTAAVATGSAAAAAAGPSTLPSTVISNIPGMTAGPTMATGVPSMPGAAPQGLAANVAARELVGELEHLRRIRDEKGRLQAQAALAAAAYSATSGAGGSPFLRPTAAAAATAIGANVFSGSMPGMIPTHQPQISQSSTSLLENQLRIQQQLEIEHERLYLERIKQERQVEEQRLRAIQEQQLRHQLGVGAVAAMSSPTLPALPPGGVHHNPALAFAASSGLITHPLGPPAPEGFTNARSNESHNNALNNYYDARNRLIAAKFDAEDEAAPSKPSDAAAGGGAGK